MFQDFVAPAVIGNAIGGVLLVALFNYGQVAAEKKRKDGKGGKDRAEEDGKKTSGPGSSVPSFPSFPSSTS